MFRKLSITVVLAITASSSIFAQQKKTGTQGAKTTSSGTKTAAGSNAGTGGINQNNYGKVVEYLNRTIDCSNSQTDEISRRDEITQKMKEFYVDGDSVNRQAPAREFAIDLVYSNTTAQCTNMPPPAIMGAADVAFYNENYKAMRDAFTSLALMWNDLASRTSGFGGMNLKGPEGVKKYNELQALLTQYKEVRSKLSSRTKTIQNQLFPYSVAKSPNKEYYIYLHDDIGKVKDFAATISSYEYLMNNKTSVEQALSQLEKDITPHLLKTGETDKIQNNDNLRNGYGSFYKGITNYINATRELMNNTNERRTDYYISSYQDALNDITNRYNDIMQ